MGRSSAEGRFHEGKGFTDEVDFFTSSFRIRSGILLSLTLPFIQKSRNNSIHAIAMFIEAGLPFRNWTLSSFSRSNEEVSIEDNTYFSYIQVT